jgi:hypothetical protein
MKAQADGREHWDFHIPPMIRRLNCYACVAPAWMQKIGAAGSAPENALCQGPYA